MASNISSLLVPVHMDALVINNDTGAWKDISLDIDNLANYDGSGGLGYYLEKNIKQTSGKTFLEKGIHLHWVLPASYRHGVQDPLTGSLQFPLAPNRWMVIRIDEQQAIESWMVESDYKIGTTNKFNLIKENVNAGNTPAGITPLAIGRCVDFTGWTEKNKDPLFLTIMAAGNPDFAASYMHSKNIFGFRDPMKDQATGKKFTYMLLGWYSDAAANPLASVEDKAALIKKLKELGWTLNDADKLTGTIPGNIFCHSMVHSITWNASPASAVPSIGSVQVGIGNSSAEALAALLRDKVNADKLTIPHKLSSAWQYKLLRENGAFADSTNLLKKQIHSKDFLAADGGTYWVVEVKEKDSVSQQDAAEDSSLPFAPAVSKLLNELNILQQEYNTTFNELNAARQALYAAKYKKVFAGTNDNNSDQFTDDQWNEIIKGLDPPVAAAKLRISTLEDRLLNLKKQTKDPAVWPVDYTGSIVVKFKELQAALQLKENNMQGFELKEVPLPKYFSPSDPAIIIDGLIDPSHSSSKYLKKENTSPGNSLPADATICRIQNQVANEIIIDTYTVPASDIISSTTQVAIKTIAAKAIDESGKKLPAELTDLINESFLLNPAMAAAISKKVNEYKDPPMQDFTQLITTVMLQADASNFSRSGSPVITPAKFAITSWQQPWTPLCMEWSVKWTSLYKDIDPSTVLANWKFGDEKAPVDYELTLPSTLNNAVEYSGRALLSFDMANKISQLNKKMTDNYGSDFFESMYPVCQTLSGFSNQLITRYHGIQLPVLNTDFSVDSDYKMIRDQYSWSPVINNKYFFPVRSGLFQLSMLRVIDSFGQALEIIPAKDKQFTPTLDNHQLKASAGLQIAGFPADGDKKQKYFVSPPRIVQPARLRFNWMSAEQPNRPTNSDPGTSPVCGWLLHNKLDNSIAVFDATGAELGELVDQNNSMQFIPPPGSFVAAAITNPVLNKVAGFIMSDRNIFNGLTKQVEAVNKKVQSKSSRQQFTMMLPVGFPVAVVSAACLLELRDPVAQHYDWLPVPVNGNFTNVNYKICVGNSKQVTDGLIGYFINGNYNEFNLPLAGKNSIGTPADFKEDATVNIKAGIAQQLTLLMDPRMAVNISSGILPAAAYELPQQVIASPMQRINLRFIAAPVITPRSVLKIPVMQKRDIHWSFISVAGKADKKIVRQNPDPDNSGLLKFEPLHAIEGWLKLNSKPI